MGQLLKDLDKYRNFFEDLVGKSRVAIFEILGDVCVSCGEEDFEILQIDHINWGGTKLREDQKSKAGSRDKWLKDEVREDTSKFQVLCPNCHQKRLYEFEVKDTLDSIFNLEPPEGVSIESFKSYKKHEISKFQMRSWRRIERLNLLETLGNQCKVCRVEDSKVLQFDHKRGRIGIKGFRPRTTLKFIRENLGEFQVLCANDNIRKKIDNKETGLNYQDSIVMLKLGRVFEISYGHRLLNHPGKCRHPHGHSAKIEVEVEGWFDSSTGMVMDFGDLKEVVSKTLDLLDHKMILQKGDPLIEALDTEEVVLLDYPPTAEILSLDIARGIGEDLRLLIPYDIIKVRFWETQNSYAETTIDRQEDEVFSLDFPGVIEEVAV